MSGPRSTWSALGERWNDSVDIGGGYETAGRAVARQTPRSARRHEQAVADDRHHPHLGLGLGTGRTAMTDQHRIWSIAGFGAITAVVLAAGAGTLGGLMALLQLGLLVGAPVALLVADELRSRAAVVVLAASLSVAISAIAVQSLVWFELATAELIVVLATAYGMVLAQLLNTGLGRRRVESSARAGGRW